MASNSVISGFVLLGIFILAMWVVELVNAGLGHSFNAYGIQPRVTSGLFGIALSPFLHAGISHVVSNTIPLAVLGGFVALQGRDRLLQVIIIVALAGGLAVWLAARSSVHIGASGIVFGFFGYLVARGWYDRSWSAVLVAIVTLFLYGGIIFGILPTIGFVSWEGHLFGLLAGILAARLLRRRVQPA
jgi:membrane associated rhomboid family serine protease